MINKKIILLIVFVIISIVFLALLPNETNNIPISCKFKFKSYEKIICLKPHFQELTITKSAAYAVKKAQYIKNEGIIDDCHLLSHFIGESTLIDNDFDFPKALTECSQECIQGCYHGVMESFIAHQNNDSDFLDSIPNICEIYESNFLLKRQCIHGIGHGLISHNFMPILKGIEFCNKFNSTFKSKTCLGGLFMENVDQYLLLDKNALSKKIPKICDLVSKSYKNLNDMCIDAVGEGLMFYTGHNLKKSLEFCNLLNKKDKLTCQKAAKLEQKNNI